VAFAIVINPILKQLAEEFPEVLTYALHDDITMLGKRQQTEVAWIRAVQLLEEKLRLKTNHAKSLNYIINSSDNTDDNGAVTIGGIHLYGINICSIPMGSTEFVRKQINDYVTEVRESITDITNRLTKIDAQVAYTVVKYSLQNKLDYLMANIAPEIIGHGMEELDKTIRDCFWKTMGSRAETDDVLAGDVEFNNDRLKIQCKNAGGGQRLLSERYSFINCANTVVPQIGKYWKSLEDITGFHDDGHEQMETAMEENRGRWTQFYERGGLMASKLKEAWISMQVRKSNLEEQLDAFGIEFSKDKIKHISMSVNNFGVSKLSHEMHEEFQYLELLSLNHRATLLPTADSRRISFIYSGNDQSSNAIFTALPNNRIRLDSTEFQEAACCHMGRYSPLSLKLCGRSIRAKNQLAFVDETGYNIKAISGVEGGHRTIFHNDIHFKIAETLVQVEINVKGRGPRDTCKNIFSDVINFNRGDEQEEHGERIIQGIIPDMIILDNRGREEYSNTLFDNLDTLLDVKTLGPGVIYHGNSKNNYLNTREEKVNREYYTCAKKLDQQFNGALEGQTGPVQHKLETFGKHGRVIGLIFGAFGEVSGHVHSLIDFIAGRYADIAGRIIDPSYDSWAELKAKKKKFLFMEWGLIIQRGWARILRDRLALLIHTERGNELAILTQDERLEEF
jgi:hypothetical protein